MATTNVTLSTDQTFVSVASGPSYVVISTGDRGCEWSLNAPSIGDGHVMKRKETYAFELESGETLYCKGVGTIVVTETT